jgi:hypothetical protein
MWPNAVGEGIGLLRAQHFWQELADTRIGIYCRKCLQVGDTSAAKDEPICFDHEESIVPWGMDGLKPGVPSRASRTEDENLPARAALRA